MCSVQLKGSSQIVRANQRELSSSGPRSEIEQHVREQMLTVQIRVLEMGNYCWQGRLRHNEDERLHSVDGIANKLRIFICVEFI